VGAARGVGDNARTGVEALIERSRSPAKNARRVVRPDRVPAIRARATSNPRRRFRPDPAGDRKAGGTLADRIVTTSPDVTVSTNLGAWVNQRGLFRRRGVDDFCQGKDCIRAKVVGERTTASISSWASPRTTVPDARGRGLSRDQFGTRLCRSDALRPFIARGLDALNYACYQDARFLLVATPSG
jgi:pyruvate dehydrogenase E1 component